MVSATLFCNFKFVKILKQHIQKYLQFLVCCEPHNIFMHKIIVHLSWFTVLYTGLLLMCPSEGKRKMYSLVGYIIIFKLIFNFIIYNYLAHPLKCSEILVSVQSFLHLKPSNQPDYNHMFATLFCFDCHM